VNAPVDPARGAAANAATVKPAAPADVGGAAAPRRDEGEPSGFAELLTVPRTFAGHRLDTPDHVRNLYSFLSASLFGYLTGAVILVLLFWEHAPRWATLGWGSAFLAMWVVRLLLGRRFRQIQDDPHTDFMRWRRYWRIGAWTAGALWGLAAVLFYGHGGSPQQIGLTLIVFTYCVVAIPVFADQRKTFAIYLALIFGPLVTRVATSGSDDAMPVAVILVLILLGTVTLAQNFRGALQHIIELKNQTQDLAAQLAVEKAAADAARAVAEAASRAKTQFFSAASHDLRQPLHAMVLFAEALRQKNRDREVAQLINSINDSVDALEGLFSELLDMTKLDSGAVEVNRSHFGFSELFGRLKLHFEPTAFEKGLDLKLRPGRLHVHADPVLVERIIRNLLSNAIRYTEDGGVLIAARPRGDKVIVQVWDSGIGIAPDSLPRIFDEFFQVSGARALDARHRKGLGLGLAIVKRLADLMGATLTVRSQLGRGTVFTLELPRGQVPRAIPPAARSAAAAAITLDGRRIVVVEDEPAVRDGLEVLLRSWGAEVEGFDTLEAVQAWADAQPPRPDLLIADYRLPEGRTGVEVIQALRRRFGRGLPAIVVTGSTMSDHDGEAQHEDFHILFKPVVPTKLRAMIAFKMGLRGKAG
jgi:signal transduction histidine kinase/CheY-like chemotaxis protein